MIDKNTELLTISYSYNRGGIQESYSIKLEDVSLLENLLDVFAHTLEVLGHGKVNLVIEKESLERPYPEFNPGDFAED